MTEAMMNTLFAGTLPLSVTEHGAGPTTFLLLHGGAGPDSMLGLAESLATTSRVVVPTHPGFAGTLRPERFVRIDDLVLAYLALLDAVDATNVVVVGNSFGGWLAAEIALRGSPRVAKIALLNAVGIAPGDRPIVDPTTLPVSERAAYSFHDPARFAAKLVLPDNLRHMPANMAALRLYAGTPFMHDPTLEGRLAALAVPALVLWGESDRIVDETYGRRFAASMPGARFILVPEAGHFPHLERADDVTGHLRALV